MDELYTRQMAELQMDHWWYEGRRRILASVIGKLNLPEGCKILEAGCGPGANLGMLSQFGALSAFDPEDFSARHASILTGLEIKTGALPKSFPFENSFDLVCAFDVVEHIDDDVSALKVLYQHTKGGGNAIFTVPAFQWLWSAHDEKNHHKRRYTKKQLKSSLEKAGYQVDFISYYNFFLFPLAASVRLFKKMFHKQEEAEIKMPSGFMNSLFCNIFSLEKEFLSVGFPFGLSILAVCKKGGGNE